MTKILHIPTGIIFDDIIQMPYLDRAPILFLTSFSDVIACIYTDPEHLSDNVRRTLYFLYAQKIIPEEYGITWKKCISYVQENISSLEFEVLDD